MDPRWTDWSDWAWDGSQARWWRARQDAQGRVEYDFLAAQAAPRGNVDDLTNSFNNVNLGGHHDAQYTQGGGAYTYDAPIAADGTAVAGGYGASSAGHPHSAYPTKGKGKGVDPHPKSKPRDKGPSRKHRSKHPKGAGNEHVDDAATAHVDRDPFYRRPGTTPGFDQASSSGVSFATQQPHADSTYGSSPHDPAYASSLSQSSGADQFYDQRSTVEPDAEVESVGSGRYAHRGHASDSGNTPPTSTVAEDPPAEDDGSDYYSTVQGSVASDMPPGQLQDAISQADPYLTGGLEPAYSEVESSSTATAHSYPYHGYGADSGRETPRPYGHQRAAAPIAAEDYHYQGNATESTNSMRELDGQNGVYVVEHSARFKPGEIFKILWCEPLGAGAPKSEVMTHQVRFEQNGRAFYQGLRRFIVVANDEGHCTCVPILTYERQACRKRGVKPLKHGIIHDAGKKPRTLAGEPMLGFNPVRVNLYEKAEQLVKESRVNYAKLTTVEHNFQVFFIGSVDPGDFQNIVIPAVDTCWERKKRR